MRIFFASDSSPDAWIQSSLWRDNLLLPLLDLGHDVVEFDYDLRETFRRLDDSTSQNKRFIERNRPRISRELLRQIRAAHASQPVDLFFSYFYSACVLPDAIDEIRSLGIKTVNWYCNGSYQLHLVSEIAPHYDWCLVPERFRLKDYRALGARPIYCQEAANPSIYKPYDVPVEFDVAFIGQRYGERPAYIKHLLDENIDVRVWGYGWQSDAAREPQWKSVARKVKRALVGPRNVPLPVAPLVPSERCGPPLSDTEMVKMYSRSKINLGFSACGETHQTDERIVQVRLRDFEVPMSGGFYMVEYMEELEEFYAIGREIVCYQGPQDLADKIKYFLARDEERETIRQAGRARCLRDHTWHKRFQAAFQEMGLQ